ncbi:MAG TPA: hypothetical protein VGG99_07070 [Acetobacteraceae bacterium]
MSDTSSDSSGSPGETVKPCKYKGKKVRAEVVTPSIVVKDAYVWFHDKIRPERNQIGMFTLKAAWTGDDLNYKGRGKFTADNHRVEFFSDSRCKKPIDPFKDVSYSFSSLKTGVKIYYKGRRRGDTELTLTLDPAKDDRITVEGPATNSVRARPANVITPKIELEYVVALLDRKPHAGAKDSNNKDAPEIPPTPTYMLVSVEQTRTEPAECQFAGTAEFTGYSTNLDLFQNMKCSKPAANLDALPAAGLTGTDKIKLWARGKKVSTAAFKLKLTLKGTEDVSQRFADPVTEDFNVSELKMTLNWNDQGKIAALQADPDQAAPGDYSLDKQLKTYHDDLVGLVIPDQITMNKKQKAGVGRFLHCQSADKSFSRARLVVNKLEAAQWPAETDDHMVTLEDGSDSGAIAVFKDADGTDPPDPMTVGDLKKKPVIVWVEGTTDSDTLCDSRLFLQLYRPERDLPRRRKRNADWARFTVVTIESVKVRYKPDPNKPEAWGVDPKRFYINFKDDPDGREVTLRARLTKNIPGVPLLFMLAPSPDNMKAANWGVDLPDRDIKTVTVASAHTAPSGTTLGGSTVSETPVDAKFVWKWNEISDELKHKDKNDRKYLVHKSKKTKSGKTVAFADMKVTLSRFGGDVFTALAYINEDPHLAKYVEGHTDAGGSAEPAKNLGARKPRPLGDAPSDPEVIEVWRKFWYQRVAVEGFDTKAGFTHGDLADAIAAYEEVVVVLDRTVADHDIDAATLNGMSPQAVYPRYMVIPNAATGSGDALVLSNSNKAQFFPSGAAPTKTPLRVPIAVCDAQWDPDGNTATKNTPFAAKAKFADVPTDDSGGTALAIGVNMGKDTCDPPLQGGDLFASGNYLVKEKIAGTSTTLAAVALASTDVFIAYQQRAVLGQVFVKWPAAVEDEFYLDGVAVANGGTGCTPASIGTSVTVNEAGVTAAQVTITAQNGGAVTAVTVANRGRYQSPQPALLTGANGLQLTPTWKPVVKQIKFTDLTVQGAKDFLGECQNGNLLAVYDPAEAADFTDTVIHECGHAFGQAPEGTPPNPPSSTHDSIPAHPNTKDLGKGNHCWFEAGTQKTSSAWVMTSATVANGGAGYDPGDVNEDEEVIGGNSETTAEIIITSVSGDAVDGVAIYDPGEYTTKPANPVAITTNNVTGAGLTIDVVWTEKEMDTSMPAANTPCVMYDSGPQPTGLHKYCSVCTPYLLAQDMSKFK